MKNEMIKGGAGVSDWGVKTFGGINEQHAANNQDNTIAMRGGRKSKNLRQSKNLRGSKNLRSTKKRGGSLIGELATPIILLTAQQNYRSKKSRNFRNNRKSRSYRRK